MAPGVGLGVCYARALAPSTSALAPLSYAVVSLVAMAYHARAHAVGRDASVALLRADLLTQLASCAITVYHTPLGRAGVAFAAACAALSMRHAPASVVAFAVNGVCVVVCSGVVPVTVYAMWAGTFVLFVAGFVRPNALTHAAFHLATNVIAVEVWKRLKQ